MPKIMVLVEVQVASMWRASFVVNVGNGERSSRQTGFTFMSAGQGREWSDMRKSYCS